MDGQVASAVVCLEYCRSYLQLRPAERVAAAKADTTCAHAVVAEKRTVPNGEVFTAVINALGPTMGQRMCLTLETMMDYLSERADAVTAAKHGGEPASAGYEAMLQAFISEDYPTIYAGLKDVPEAKWQGKMARQMPMLLRHISQAEDA